jgi:hypothetical protein
LELSGYAVQFRYETLPEGEEPLDRHTLLEDARVLVEGVEQILAQESR